MRIFFIMNNYTGLFPGFLKSTAIEAISTIFDIV